MEKKARKEEIFTNFFGQRSLDAFFVQLKLSLKDLREFPSNPKADFGNGKPTCYYPLLKER